MSAGAGATGAIAATRRKARVTPTELVRAMALPASVATIYVGLVLTLWIPFGPANGMPYETAFVYVAETTSFFDGYTYLDPLRKWTQLFYTMGYRLSDLLGVDGSFLGLQLVYAALWWARGMLAFLIIRRLVPSSPLLAFAAGALVLAHASDHALNWVGQLNQFGVIFWMLLSIYLLVLALQQVDGLRRAVATGGAAWAAYMSLWSYESPLFIIVLVPVLVLLYLGVTRERIMATGLYLLVPLYYGLKNLSRYVGGEGATYQESVLRDDRNPGVLIGDLWFNIESSLRFWDWGEGLPPLSGGDRSMLWGLIAAMTFLVGAVAVTLLAEPSKNETSARQLALLGLGAAAVVVASFPAYLVLTSARQLWRTQFLAGAGTGILLAVLVSLIAIRARHRLARAAIVGLGGAVIVFYGVQASYQAASFHYGIWDRHRDAVAEILHAAPRVKEQSMVVLTGVPKNADPFGDNMWFDMAVRLAYPSTQVAGIYFYEDGTPSPSQNMELIDGAWRLETIGFATLVPKTAIENTVIVRYRRDAAGQLLVGVPLFITRDAATRARYRPEGVIAGDAPAPFAARRYLEGS